LLQGSPGEIRTPVKGSKGLYPCPLDDRAPAPKIPTHTYKTITQNNNPIKPQQPNTHTNETNQKTTKKTQNTGTKNQTYHTNRQRRPNPRPTRKNQPRANPPRTNKNKVQPPQRPENQAQPRDHNTNPIHTDRPHRKHPSTLQTEPRPRKTKTPHLNPNQRQQNVL
jgi:hypothetical protein